MILRKVVKIQILEKVLKQERYDNERFSLIIKAIRNVQNMRNKAAHWRILVFHKRGEVKLRKKSEEEMLSFTDEMLQRLEEDKEIEWRIPEEFEEDDEESEEEPEETEPELENIIETGPEYGTFPLLVNFNPSSLISAYKSIFSST